MRDTRDVGRPARLVAAVVAVALGVASILTHGMVGYADPTAATDDRSVALSVAEWSYTGLTPAQVQTDLNANGARLTRIVADPGSSTRTFTVTMVKNAGPYQVGSWSWVSDVTGATLDADLAAANGRPIFADAYDTPSGELFAAVWVVNSGADARSWWWVRDDNTGGGVIQQQLNVHNARLQEVRSYMVGATEYQLGIMVAQTGIDAKSWTWQLFASVATIRSAIATNHYRLISLEPNPGSGFDVVMVQSEGETWSWTTNLSWSSLQASVIAKKSRLIGVSSYGAATSPVYAAILLDNTDKETAAINAESKRVGAVLAKGLGNGVYGMYLRKVGTPAAVLGLNQSFRYEPASAIKVLYLLYAMVQVQGGTDSLSSDVIYYPDPSNPTNPGVCPDPAWETPSNAQHATLQQALTAMMQVSDNRMTRSMALRYGIANVDSYAHSIGMSSTRLRQDRIGCLFVNAVRNQTTGMDLGKLYEQVDTHSLLTAPNVGTFYGFMLGGPVSSSSALGTVVSQEAAKQGKQSDVPAFIAAMQYHEKAGNEFMCVSSNCGATPQYLDFTSVSGVMVLPFKSSGSIVPTDYVYTRFGNDFVVSCVPGSSGCADDTAEVVAITTVDTGGAETDRQQIAAALSTW